MTEHQWQQIDENGFVILDDFLTPAEVERFLVAVDEVASKILRAKDLGPNDPVGIRNTLAHHEAFLDLIDDPRILSLVVDSGPEN